MANKHAVANLGWLVRFPSLFSQNSELDLQYFCKSFKALAVSTLPCSSYSSEVNNFIFFLKSGGRKKNILKNLKEDSL